MSTAAAAESLIGRSVLIAGATGGIGHETARALDRSGARVIITGRERDTGERAAAAIRYESGQDSVMFLRADHSTVGGNRDLADRVPAAVSRLNALINNVGGLFPTRWETPDGYKATLAMNFVGPYAHDPVDDRGDDAVQGRFHMSTHREDMRRAWDRINSFPTQRLDSRFGTIEYADEGQGLPLLVSHGVLGCHVDSVNTQWANLSGRGFRIIVPSRFGYLGSTLQESATPADQADAYALLLEHLGVDRAVVIGFSAGSGSIPVSGEVECLDGITDLVASSPRFDTGRQSRARSDGAGWWRAIGRRPPTCQWRSGRSTAWRAWPANKVFMAKASRKPGPAARTLPW